MSYYQLLACGSNGNSQLGVSDKDDHDSLRECQFLVDGEIKTIVPFKPVKFAFGGNHTFVLLENGHLYSCGDNSYGQCGHSSEMDSFSIFTKVKGDKWSDISCGWEFSVLVDQSDRVYVCGLGLKGELGLGKDLKRTELAPMNNHWGEIKSVKSSVGHTIVQLANGDFYGWGNCRKGQLGTIPVPEGSSKPPSVFWEPRLLKFNVQEYSDFALGRDYTVFLTQEKVRSFGKVSVDIDAPNAVSVRAMWSSIHYLEVEGDSSRIVSVGNNSHGQLFPASSVSIESFEIGSEHGLIISSDNEVFAWGWGEHGNCGTKTSKSSNVDQQVTFDTMNLLYNKDHVVRSINCGCATSWVLIEKRG